MIDVPDQELIKRTLEDQNQRAYGLLVQRYQSQIRLSLRKWCSGDEALADDLAQEAFIKAYQALPGFRGDAKFSTWIYRIAFNVAMSHRRKQGLLLIDDLEVNQEQQEEHVNEAEQSAMQRDITWAMAQLSEAQQTLIDLCLNRGFSHQEAADITGFALGTVKSHVNRGKARLKELMLPWKEEVAHG